MKCDERPHGDACNCCGDAELQDRLRELITRIHELETRQTTLESRPVPTVGLLNCAGEPLATNTRVMTCDSGAQPPSGGGGSGGSSVLVDCAGSPITRAPSCESFSDLVSTVQQIENQITNINNTIGNMGNGGNSGGSQPPTGSPLTPGIINNQIDGIRQVINRLEQSINNFGQRIAQVEACCEENRRRIEKLENNTGGADCVFEGWSVYAASRFVQHNEPDYGRRFEAVIRGPKLKSVTVMTPQYQRAVVTDDAGNAQIFWEENPGLGAGYSGVVRLIHCGREVASSNVFHV